MLKNWMLSLLLLFIGAVEAQEGQCFKANRNKPVGSSQGSQDNNNRIPSSSNGGGSCLNAHNQYRQSWGVGPLSWSSSLASEAQNWANYLNYRRKFEHAENTDHGENLYSGDGSCISALESWMSEPYRRGAVTSANVMQVGHLTQIIWKDTNEVGCASSGAVVVCRYNPPGNYLGTSPI